MQVFYIHPTGNGYIISDGTPANAIAIADQQAVQKLYERLGAFLQGDQDDGMLFLPKAIEPDLINSIEARQIAKEQGHELSITTLNSACSRGAIRNARKEQNTEKARWQMPRHEFLYWFENWKKAQAKGSQRGKVQPRKKAV